MSNNIITPDIYGITDHINDLKKDYFSANEESLMVGTLGYIGSILASQWENQIVMASQYSNEAISTKAKFKRNIIAHALSFDAISITATPACMDVQVVLLENEVERNLNEKNQFIIDSTQPIYIEDFEFHFDYDIILTKTKIKDDYVYTARYKDIGTNPISDVTNPYLSPPVIIDMDEERSIMILCKIHQVSTNTTVKNIISSNSLENKTFSFNFEDQLAYFGISVTDGDTTKSLTPVYTGMYDGSVSDYFNYDYIDDKTIRVKFESSSYLPRINTIIQLDVITTKGTAGIFKYTGYAKLTMKSSKYGYSNLSCVIRPATESTYGAQDSKTIKELKTIIPKQALSRGNIVTSTDLNNYFDLINTTDSKLYFMKRRHNQFDMLFYSHFLFRDGNNNILPTNTIDIEVSSKSDLLSLAEDRLFINPGTIIQYSPYTQLGQLLSKEDYEAIITTEGYSPDTDYNFYYTTPFSLVINKSPLRASYYLNIINTTKILEFSWVNQESEIQFVCSNVQWKREYSDDPYTRNNYVLFLSMVQNVKVEKELILRDETGEEIAIRNVRVFVVFYNESDKPYRYAEMDLDLYDDNEFIYDFITRFETNDILTKNDKLIVYNVSDIGNSNAGDNYGDFVQSPKVVIYTAIKYPDVVYGKNELIDIVPDISDWTITNKYTVIDNLDFFYNYSDIISSTVTVREGNEAETIFKIQQVPVLKYEYLNDIINFYDFLDQMEIRRQYIDDCMDKLEGAMGIDFKFYNTYGPSTTYFINDETCIDKVNMSLKFRLKIMSNADKYIRDYITQDVKEYIENIDDISDLHMPNITTLIENKYQGQIQYFQFVGINNYDTSVQHVTLKDILDHEREDYVPELLNVDVDSLGNPKIELIVDT